MSTDPDFIFVGPDKTGSSYIFEYLKCFDEVHVPPQKELWFFDRSFNYSSIANYRKNFVPKKINVEVSHNYVSSPFALSNIMLHLPNVQVIVCKRNRSDRLVSQYRQLRKMGYAKGNIYEAVSEFPVLLLNSLVGYHLSQLPDNFLTRVHVVDFELLKNDEFSFQAEICKVLGLKPRLIALGKVNESLPPRSTRLNLILSLLAVALRRNGFGGFVTRIKTNHFAKSLLFRQTSDAADVLSLTDDEQFILDRFFRKDEVLLNEIEAKMKVLKS